MKNKKFPLFVDLHQTRILVFGGGRIASRRIGSLLDYAENICVISPGVSEEIQREIRHKRVSWKEKEYEASDLEQAQMVLAATDDHQVNHEIFEECRKRKIPVNNAGDQSECDFQFPGIISHEGITIGFNSGGSDHKKTRKIREEIEKFLKGPEERK